MLDRTGTGSEEGWDALERVALALRGPEDLGTEVDGAVMAALRAAPLAVRRGELRSAPARAGAARRATPGWQRGVRWLVQPRTVRVSPLAALAAAALTFVAAMFGLRKVEGTARQDELAGTGEWPRATGEFPAVSARGADVVSAAANRSRTAVVQRFTVVAPDAKDVALVGDFNDWNQGATPMRRVAQVGTGIWTVEVALPPGRYSYAFLVDGQRWVADPAAPRAIGDDFGRPSSVVTVAGGSTA